MHYFQTMESWDRINDFPIAAYLLVRHNGRDIGAFAHKRDDNWFTFNIQEDFFVNAELRFIPLEQRTQIQEEIGYLPFDTYARTIDRNKFITFVDYDDGQVKGAKTWDREMNTIFPNIGFNFLVDLLEAVQESRELPQNFKQNLGRVANITSLDDFFRGFQTGTGTPIDEIFNRRYLSERWRGYLPENAQHIK